MKSFVQILYDQLQRYNFVFHRRSAFFVRKKICVLLEVIIQSIFFALIRGVSLSSKSLWIECRLSGTLFGPRLSDAVLA